MVHRALKLQHHRHTAKRLPHEHTSYRGLFVVLALTALCFGMIQGVRADDLEVSATVPSAVLDQPAVITSPTTGAVVTTDSVEIKGTCQVVIDGTVVVLERDGAVLGSQTCPSNGKFAITISLVAGENVILPKVYTSANVPGPDGTPVKIVRQINVPASAPTGEASRTSSVPGAPLSLHLDDPFLVYRHGEPAKLTVTPSGGTLPYTLKIDWGDGSGIEEWIINSGGVRMYEHQYKVTNSYKVSLVLEDAAGTQYQLQLTAVGLNVPALTLASPRDPMAGLKAWFASPVTRLVWGGYALVSAATIVLWWVSPNHTLLWQGTAPGRSLFKRRH